MTRSKLSFRPRASVLALEPRVLFDGAGAMAAVDYLADVPAKTESAKEVEAEKTPATAAPVTLASPRAEDAGISRVGTDSVITTVLIVDTRVADYASLLAGLPANAVLRVVDSGESGLNAVSQALAGLQGIESVQIISHGTPGSFTLGSDTVDAASVAAHGAQLQAWAGHLTADADILLYGCDVGQGAQGESLITQLAAVTGADIAASSNATGAAAKGGDWVLERNTGAGRLAGFMQAMKEAHISVPENWIVQGDFEPESGYRAMQQIVSQPHRPTAVFCGGDIMAMGALCAADELGLRVPQDISVIGYDNVRNARFFTPALTTIHQPKDSLGETAFNMLMDRIVNKREESQSIEVHPRLIERRSVADGPFRDYRR